MSAVKKTDYLPDAATLDLWRVAECGDVDQLASVLPRLRDINARNEHGVTALMRAAQYGHVTMVQALLKHGAEANIQRNDKFTALALAAFFGHTNVVRALMEHGADSQASTRYDTSPHMWATARTFREVVTQLEKPAPRKIPTPVAAPLSTPKAANPAPPAFSGDPVMRAVVKSSEVRTLKEPPEIWDLVQEVPRGFNPRMAFLTRLKSLKTGLAFRLAAIAVLVVASAIGVMILTGVPARNEADLGTASRQPPVKQPAGNMDVRSNPAPVENDAQPAAAATATDTATPLPDTTIDSEVNRPGSPLINRTPRTRTSHSNSRRVAEDLTQPPAAIEPMQPVEAPVAKATVDRGANASPKTNAKAPLSPQLIAPAKDSGVKKKVIQWP